MLHDSSALNATARLQPALLESRFTDILAASSRHGLHRLTFSEVSASRQAASVLWERGLRAGCGAAKYRNAKASTSRRL